MKMRLLELSAMLLLTGMAGTASADTDPYELPHRLVTGPDELRAVCRLLDPC